MFLLQKRHNQMTQGEEKEGDHYFSDDRGRIWLHVQTLVLYSHLVFARE
jgi:hypothetical protein